MAITRTMTLPKGLVDQSYQDIRDTISAWHIIRKIERTGNVITWTQSIGYGAGAESLDAYVEGLTTAIRIMTKNKRLELKTTFEND